MATSYTDHHVAIIHNSESSESRLAGWLLVAAFVTPADPGTTHVFTQQLDDVTIRGEGEHGVDCPHWPRVTQVAGFWLIDNAARLKARALYGGDSFPTAFEDHRQSEESASTTSLHFALRALTALADENNIALDDPLLCSIDSQINHNLRIEQEVAAGAARGVAREVQVRARGAKVEEGGRA